MKKYKSVFEKWFSIVRHKRRMGASSLSKSINTNFASQKKLFIDDGEIQYTYGSSNDLSEHFKALRKEFSNQSEFCYTHAKLIVLIRREYDTKKHFDLLETLWEEEQDFLIKNLNIRWLISAADSFVDYSTNDLTKGLSIAAVSLFNTVKLQESERLLTNTNLNNYDDPSIQKRLDSEERIPLFDGTEIFKFGTSDSLRNMRWRINKLSKSNPGGSILLEIFKRLQNYDTVYSRAKKRHKRKKTEWW